VTGIGISGCCDYVTAFVQVNPVRREPARIWRPRWKFIAASKLVLWRWHEPAGAPVGWVEQKRVLTRFCDTHHAASLWKWWVSRSRVKDAWSLNPSYIL